MQLFARISDNKDSVGVGQGKILLYVERDKLTKQPAVMEENSFYVHRKETVESESISAFTAPPGISLK